MASASSPLEEAVRRARYNETIHVQIEDEDSDTGLTNVCLVPTITASGDIEFERCHNILERELQTNRWFFPMLNDTKRNQLYDACIQKHVKDKTVLEIGTGTGLLSLLAEKHGAKRITSLEMSSPQSEIARAVIPDHSIIEIRNEHSTETNLDIRYEICISELLEDGLLGEGWLPAMRDAWDRHLVPSATVIPASASVYGQLVYYSGLPPPSTNDIVVLGTGESPDFLNTEGKVLPMHTSEMLRSGAIKTVSDVFRVFDFDVSSPDRIPTVRSKEIMVDTIRAPSNAVMVWWNLGLDESSTYDIDPNSLDQDHWHPCLHFIPDSPGQSGTLALHASHDDNRIRIILLPNDKRVSPPKAKKTKVDTASAPIVSIERTIQLRDRQRLNALQHAIRDSLRPNDLVLDVSDYPIAGCIAAKIGAKKVVSLESSSGDIPIKAAQMAQLENKLQNLDVFQCYPESLDVDHLGKHISLVVCEPYFHVLEGWHLHEAIRLAGIIKTLRARELVSSNTRFVPSACRVRGCLIGSRFLKSAYNHCGDDQEKIQGFDHSFVNSLGWSTQFPLLSLPLWQYGITELSAPFDLGFLSYHAPNTSITQTTIKPQITRPGLCDGLKVWVEYSLTEHINWSTNDSHHNQLLQMASRSFDVSESKTVECSASLGPKVNGTECQYFQINLQSD